MSAERGNNGLETHGIEILDEPGQIVGLKTGNNVLIFSPTKKADELVVKLGRGFVEVVEWFQAVVRDHGKGNNFRVGCQASRCPKFEAPDIRLVLGR